MFARSKTHPQCETDSSLFPNAGADSGQSFPGSNWRESARNMGPATAFANSYSHSSISLSRAAGFGVFSYRLTKSLGRSIPATDSDTCNGVDHRPFRAQFAVYCMLRDGDGDF